MLEVQDGSFRQEPGSGVSGIVQGSAVAVGNLEWVRSHSQPHSESQHASTSGNQTSSDQNFSCRIGSRHDAHNGASTDSFRGSSHQTPQHNSLDSSSSTGSSTSSSTSSSMDSGVDQRREMRERQSSNGGASSSQAGSNSGLITVYVGVDGKLAGCFEISDQLRSDAAATITGLQEQGIEAILLSGVHCLLLPNSCFQVSFACIPQVCILGLPAVAHCLCCNPGICC